MTPDVDLLIVGAGPAGTAAALGALAQRPEARVALMDRARFPRDKTCGDGIGPVGVELLTNLGAGGVLEGAMRVERLRITTATGATTTGKVDAPGFVLPRQVLDARLVQAAVDRGATFVHDRLTRLVSRVDGVEVNGQFTAAVVVGADGVHSAVRREIGAGAHPRRHRAVSLRAYARAPAGEPQLVFRLPHDPWPSYAWAFPTGPEEANVGVVLLDGRTPSSRAALVSFLAHAMPEWEPLPGTVRGFHLPLSPGRPPLARGRVLLAGDAAGLVNPVSGEGIATALVSGMLAGRSAVGEPARAGREYRAAMRRHLGRHLRHVGWAARAMRSHAWTDATVAAADDSPRVFSALAEATVGTGPFPLSAGARIGMRRVRVLSRG